MRGSRPPLRLLASIRPANYVTTSAHLVLSRPMHERLRMFLVGVRSGVSALHLLDGYADILEIIWYHVLTPIERYMGSKPFIAWDREWVRVVVESMYGYDCVDTLPRCLVDKLFGKDGICTFERMINKTKMRMRSQQLNYVASVYASGASGITVDEYRAYVAYESITKVAMRKSILERSNRYTALVYNWYNCLVKLAASTEATRRHSNWGYTPLYCTIAGKRGLQANDSIWSSLLSEGVTIGHEFVTRIDCEFIQPFKSNFRSEAGMYNWVVDGPRIENQLIDSDVVCLENFPREKELHRCAIQMQPSWVFKLPPFSTVKLVDIKQPGEWQPYPYEVKVRRRLFVIRASYALAN